MIRHVVMFKFKPEVPVEEAQAVLAELRALPTKVSAISQFAVGEDQLRAARSWDAVLISSFADWQKLDEYQKHDDHQQVAVKLRAISEAIAAVDYEADFEVPA